MSQTYILRKADPDREMIRANMDSFVRKHWDGLSLRITIEPYEERRTREQNDRMWGMLDDVSHQCKLVVNGKLVWATKDDWKEVFTAALRQHQRTAEGVDGGVVLLGARTSKMGKREMGDLMELVGAYGKEHRVVFWSLGERAAA
jgi:hypothetical protein